MKFKEIPNKPSEIPCADRYVMLQNAVAELLKIEVADLEEKLRVLPTSKLVADRIIMANLKLQKLSYGDMGYHVCKFIPTGSSLWSPIFKRGQAVVAKTQGEETPKFSVPATVQNVDRQSITIDLSINVSEEAIKRLKTSEIMLYPLADPLPFERMLTAIENVRNYEPNGVDLASIMTGNADISSLEYAKPISLDPELNEGQKSAIQTALENQITVIHGPPGTGKSKVLTEIVRKLHDNGEKVMLCAPSNLAVDNLVESLSPSISASQKLVRVGRRYRTRESVYDRHSLTKFSMEDEMLQTLKRALENKCTLFNETQFSTEQSESNLRREIDKLRGELMNYMDEVQKEILSKASIVAATLQTAACQLLADGEFNFTTLIIDEVCQAFLPECFIPCFISKSSKRLVVAGDDKQLSPVVTSQLPWVKQVLNETLFSCLIQYYSPGIKSNLSVQYRMSKEIMKFPSEYMYDSRLEAHDSVASQLLCDHNWVMRNPLTEIPLLWISTTARNCPEKRLGTSRANDNQARTVITYLKKLTTLGVREKDIGVIVPYRAQAALIIRFLEQSFADVEVSTVDGFQGREKDVIIFDLVRSNTNGNLGFCDSPSRINVAITRARRLLLVIGNPRVALAQSRSTFLKSWTAWFLKNQKVQALETSEMPDISKLLLE